MSYPNLPPVLDFELRDHTHQHWLDEYFNTEGGRAPGTQPPPGGWPDTTPENTKLSEIESETESDPDPDPPNANPGPAPAPEPSDEPKTLTADTFSEVLIGGDNDDIITGAKIMVGGAGDDTLKLGFSGAKSGETIMIGGPGADVFDATGVGQTGGVRIVDFQDGVDKIKYPLLNDEFSAYTLAVEAGLQWNMSWIADEMGNGVVIEHDNSDHFGDLTILGVRLENLQIEIVNGDLFIV